jgi:hypothetical protein
MNIRLDWKDLLGANTLAFWEHYEIEGIKMFIALAPGVHVMSLFSFLNKLERLSMASLSGQVYYL